MYTEFPQNPELIYFGRTISGRMKAYILETNANSPQAHNDMIRNLFDRLISKPRKCSIE